MKRNHLKGITWSHIRGYGPLEASVKPYEALTGISIGWDKRSLKDFGDVSIDQLSREYDLIIMDHPHTGAAASWQCITPFDEILDKETLHDFSFNSVGPSFDSYCYDDRQWALPIDAACQVASYRKDLLLRPTPRTWREVFELANQVKSQKQYIGMALCPTDCLCAFLTLCAQQGDAPSEDKGFLISKKTALYVLNMLRKLQRACHPESLHWNPIDLYDRMSSDNEIVYCPLAFGYVNYSRAGYSQHQLRYCAIPGKSGALLGGAGITVSNYCRNIPAAAQYAAWLCSEEFQTTLYVETGGQPAHKKAWMNKKINEMSSHFYENTLSTIEKAYVRPRMINWPAFQEKLGEIIHCSLLNNTDLKKTWREISDCYSAYFNAL